MSAQKGIQRTLRQEKRRGENNEYKIDKRNLEIYRQRQGSKKKPEMSIKKRGNKS